MAAAVVRVRTFKLTMIGAIAVLSVMPRAMAAPAEDAAWKATSHDVVKGLGRCYVEPRHKQSWRLSGDHLIWETRSLGRVKVDRRAEVPIAIIERATLGRAADAPGYPYMVEMRLERAVTAAATVGGQFNPDFNYETATLACALKKEGDAERLKDAINHLIELARGNHAPPR